MEFNSELYFLKSAMSLESSMFDISQVVQWIKNQNEIVRVKVNKIPFGDLRLWSFDDLNKSLKHDTGKFFSIDGISVQTNWGEVENWDQPIINQPEIGYLGFIAKEFDGVLHFLLQAKIEPGNVNSVQLSPTLQATKSNYTRAHNGKVPAYLDYFVNARPDQILLDQLQSEQGARFLRKRNRNIIIKVEDEIPLLDNFIWVTLAQIKKLMKLDNIVNMDTRTVISGIPFGSHAREQVDMIIFLDKEIIEESFEAKVLRSVLTNEGGINTFDSIVNFITKQKAFFELSVDRIPLCQVKNWLITDYEIKHVDEKYFKIIGVEVTIDNREMVSWTQPMVEPSQVGLCAFVCKEINGVLHFLVQAKLECGNFDLIEFAPTVQCLTGNYKETKQGLLPFLDYVLNASEDKIIFDTLQSEEGGRFYKEQNRNMVVLSGDEIDLDIPDNYIWMTLNQLLAFIKYNNYINIQARSLIAALSFK
jgi:oxidase EvaA